jgi:cephalosporin hydroxylase
MFKRLLKQVARLVAPKWAAEKETELWTKKQARMVRNQYRDADLERVVDAILTSRFFPATQKRAEILLLLSLLTDLRPRFLCEIGSASGGTLFLLCQVAAPDATILSLDIEYTRLKRAVFPCFRRGSQRVICLAADSHAPATLHNVVKCLAGNRLDFLFIDGDHSWNGVKSDFEMYAPLVRPGGIVAFHDIVPDFRTRYGTPTVADVGQVPEYWAKLKSRPCRYDEFIEDPNQDGCGIGVIHCNSLDMLELNRG